MKGQHPRMSAHLLAMKGFSLSWSAMFLASFRDEVGSEAGISGHGSVLARTLAPSSQS